MHYRVTYRKPFNGDEEEQPRSAAEILGVPEGVVQDAKLVEETDPPPATIEDPLEADDDSFAFGSEVWEYDVTPGREGEFEYAIQNSEFAIEMIELDEIEPDGEEESKTGSVTIQ